MIIYGRYKWNTKRVGYRNDYCLTCSNQTIAQQFRSLYVGHIFFIPILPLGYWNKWHCANCGSEPHARASNPRTIIMAMALLLGLFSIPMWMTALTPGMASSDAMPMIATSIGLTAASIGMIFWYRNSPVDTQLNDMLKTVAPASPDNCAFCQGRLMDGYCPSCQVHRHEVEIKP